jgi:replicative DNA helicase
VKPQTNGHLDRLPPHEPEAERGVLGCCLWDENCLDAAAERLRAGPEAFYDLRHATVYRLMQGMRAEGRKVDTVTVYQELKDRKLLEDCGGVAYVAAMPNEVPSPESIHDYAQVVENRYLLRRMISACTSAVDRLYDLNGSVSAEEALSQVEAQVLAVRPLGRSQTFTPIREIVQQAIDKIEQNYQRKGAIGGLSTGFPDLDKLTDGLHAGEMVVIAAYPSVGKTSLAMNILESIVLDQGQPAGAFSLEMTATSLVVRMLSSRSRVNMRNVGDGFMTERDFQRLAVNGAKLSASNLFIEDISDLSIAEFRAKARRMAQQYGIKALVVDYLQLLTCPGAETRNEEIAQISHGIKAAAKELRIPVLALSQLNDDGKTYGSRIPHQDADGLWLLENAEEDDQATTMTVNLHIRKQREGPRGTVKLTFLKAFTRFESAAKIRDEDYRPATNDP